MFRNINLVNVVEGHASGQHGMTGKTALLLQRLANVLGENDIALQHTTPFSATSTRPLRYWFELVHAAISLNDAAMD
jgi:hypothetical protein